MSTDPQGISAHGGRGELRCRTRLKWRDKPGPPRACGRPGDRGSIAEHGRRFSDRSLAASSSTRSSLGMHMSGQTERCEDVGSRDVEGRRLNAARHRRCEGSSTPGRSAAVPVRKEVRVVPIARGRLSDRVVTAAERFKCPKPTRQIDRQPAPAHTVDQSFSTRQRVERAEPTGDPFPSSNPRPRG